MISALHTPGLKIKGIIKSYKAAAGENISAGDFVKILGSDTLVTDIDNTQLSSNAISNKIDMVSLDKNTIFMAYSVSSDRYLYGRIIKINNDTITLGSETMLSSTAQKGYNISVCAINANKVFIGHTNETTNYTLAGMVCTINGTTISAGTDTQLSTVQNSSTYISCVTVDENRIAILHSGESSCYLYGLLCTINGTTISAGTDTKRNNNSYTGRNLSCLLIEQGVVHICNSEGSALLYSIDDTSISYVASGQYEALGGTNICKGARLSKNRFLELFSCTAGSFSNLYANILRYDSKNKRMYAEIDLYTCSKLTTNDSQSVNYRVIASITLSEDEVLAVYTKNSTLCYRVIYINGYNENQTTKTLIAPGEEFEIGTLGGSSYGATALQLGIGKAFIAFANDCIYGLQKSCKIGKIKVQVETILGVAQNSGTEGDRINVYMPDNIYE